MAFVYYSPCTFEVSFQMIHGMLEFVKNFTGFIIYSIQKWLLMISFFNGFRVLQSMYIWSKFSNDSRNVRICLEFYWIYYL